MTMTYYIIRWWCWSFHVHESDDGLVILRKDMTYMCFNNVVDCVMKMANWKQRQCLPFHLNTTMTYMSFGDIDIGEGVNLKDTMPMTMSWWQRYNLWLWQWHLSIGDVTIFMPIVFHAIFSATIYNVYCQPNNTPASNKKYGLNCSRKLIHQNLNWVN